MALWIPSLLTGGAMDESFFAGIEITELEILGRRVRFPVRYYDGATMGASFLAPVDNVRPILPSDKLVPLEPVSGMAVVSMSAMIYGRVEGLAPYNEFGVMVDCLYKKDSDDPGLPGAYVYQLPVTTEEARLGGVEIYGYPKFLAEIDSEDQDGMRCCRVHAGREIVTLQVSAAPTALRSWESWTYTVKDGQLVRTLIQSRGQIGGSQAPGGATFALGDHPVAEQLRALGIGEASIGHQYVPQVQLMLHAPGERLAL
jgi:hypothetical protein